MALRLNKTLGIVLFLGGLGALGLVSYELFGPKSTSTTTTNTDAAVTGPSITFSPGQTVKAYQTLTATVTWQNQSTTTNLYGVQGAVIDSSGAVLGHFFLNAALDQTANQSQPSARIQSQSVATGGKGRVTLVTTPHVAGNYTVLFWIADNPPAGQLIAQDPQGVAQSSITVSQNLTQLTSAITVTG